MAGTAAVTSAGIGFGWTAWGQDPTWQSVGIALASVFGGALASTALSKGYQAAQEVNAKGRAAGAPQARESSIAASQVAGETVSGNISPSQSEDQLVSAYVADPSLPSQRDPVLSARTDAQLAKLHPDLQTMAREHLFTLRQAGVDVDIAWDGGYRSLEVQERLYAQGRTAPGPRVTKVPPGESPHNWGAAYDIRIEVNGTIAGNRDSIWNLAGNAGRSLGLRWGGDFTSIVDRPHFELFNWRVHTRVKSYAE